MREPSPRLYLSKELHQVFRYYINFATCVARAHITKPAYMTSYVLYTWRTGAAYLTVLLVS